MSTPCTSCTKIAPILSCTDSWSVGTVSNTYDGIELNYRLTNLATGNVQTGLTDTIAGGVVTITFASTTDLPGHWYRLELSELPGDPNIDITIDGTTNCCVEFWVNGGAGDEAVFTTTIC